VRTRIIFVALALECGDVSLHTARANRQSRRLAAQEANSSRKAVSLALPIECRAGESSCKVAKGRTAAEQ